MSTQMTLQIEYILSHKQHIWSILYSFNNAVFSILSNDKIHSADLEESIPPKESISQEASLDKEESLCYNRPIHKYFL